MNALDRELKVLRNLCACAADDNAVTEAESELATLRKDAERYRWLRKRDIETIGRGGVFAGQTPENVVLNGEDLDAAIDAAILSGHKENGNYV